MIHISSHNSTLSQLRTLCATTAGQAKGPVMSTGLAGLDSALPRGGLDRCGVHEWIGVSEPRGGEPDHAPTNRAMGWSPPLTVLAQLAGGACAAMEGSRARIVWIGRGVWPYAPALGPVPGESDGGLLGRSLFVDAGHPAERLWAADLSLRSRAAAAVIADGSGLDLASTRRLQLAAEAGSTPCLLARPPWERTMLSAATTRWLVRTCPCATDSRRWTVELLRCKGVQPSPHAPRVWTLERDHATRTLAVAPDLFDGPGQAALGPPRAWLTG